MKGTGSLQSDERSLHVARIFKGIYANGYGQLVVALTQLAGVPVLLYFWGTQLYGEWLILFAIPSFLAMTDLGFSQSAANDMSQRLARGDTAGGLCVFQSLVGLVFAATLAGLLIVSVILLLVPLGDWLPIHAITPGAAHWILWLLAAEVFVRLTEGASHAGFRASGEYPFHVSIYYTTMLLQHCAVWLLAALGYGPIAAAAAFLLVRAVVTPTVAVLLVHRHSWLHYGFEHARLTELRSLAKPAIANVGFPLAQSLNIQGMVLVVGAALGPLAVVTFSALRTLTRVALQAVLTVSHAAEPELAVAYGAGNNALLKRLYEQIARMGMWLAVLAALGLSFFGDWIVDTWTHGHVTMNTALFNWLLATSVSGALWYSSLTVLKGANLHLRAIYVYAVTAALAVVIAYVTMVKTGWIEMAGATLLLIDGAMVAYTLQAAGRICGTTTWRLLLHVMNPLPLLLQYKKRADAA